MTIGTPAAQPNDGTFTIAIQRNFPANKQASFTITGGIELLFASEGQWEQAAQELVDILNAATDWEVGSGVKLVPYSSEITPTS